MVAGSSWFVLKNFHAQTTVRATFPRVSASKINLPVSGLERALTHPSAEARGRYLCL
jgi:hypothetical protein